MKRILLIMVLAILRLCVIADEGVWIPALLEKQIFTKLQSGGLQLKADAIYSETNPSIKDAIVLLSSGCTAGIVSSQGLLLTNYHCAVTNIVPLNTAENQIIKNGFWAKSNSEEIPLKGLTATVLVSAKEVTDIVLLGIDDSLNENERIIRIKQNCSRLEEDVTKGTAFKASVESFLGGNQYFLFVHRIYKDIRLVGVPPENLNFGSHTDNWQWPRHCADFAFYRLYADRNNNPTDYSPNNIPFEPQFHLKINAKGVHQGDFTMLMGYPANTNAYLSSEAIGELESTVLPLSVSLLKTKVTVIERYTENNEELRIKQSAVYLLAQNNFLKEQGYLSGFRRYNVFEEKKQREFELIKKDSANNRLLAEIELTFKKKKDLAVANKIYTDGFLVTDAIRFAIRFKKIAESRDEASFIQNCEKTKQQAIHFFETYDRAIDSSITCDYFERFRTSCYSKYWYPAFESKSTSKELSAFLKKVYSKSWMLDSSLVFKFLSNKDFSKQSKILKDPLYSEALSIYNYCVNYVNPLNTLIQQHADSLQRKYIHRILGDTIKNVYPDANYSLRLSYGSIQPYTSLDAVQYDWFSTHRGLLEKQSIKTPFHDYNLDSSMNGLLQRAQFGKWRNENGDLPICFIANNHTSAASSGSPVMNARGEMIGLNMDRNIDGTINDFFYSKDHCRNISVDIRYVLFILDQYAKSPILSELDVIY